MKSYPVSEKFFSVQGEGIHLGRRAYFVRLFGCPLKCDFCDSKDAWNGSPDEILSSEQIAQEAKKSNADFVVITGGEPCIHNLLPLLASLKEVGIAVHLETSGYARIDESEDVKFTWVAVSPKLFEAPKPEALERADELKYIVSELSQLEEFAKFTNQATNAKAVWLHPEWSKVGDKKLLDGLTEFVKANGGLYRLGWQMHKCYSVR